MNLLDRIDAIRNAIGKVAFKVGDLLCDDSSDFDCRDYDSLPSKRTYNVKVRFNNIGTGMSLPYTIEEN